MKNEEEDKTRKNKRVTKHKNYTAYSVPILFCLLLLFSFVFVFLFCYYDVRKRIYMQKTLYKLTKVSLI